MKLSFKTQKTAKRKTMETNDKINEMRDEELNKIHADSLGLSVPENYFSNSKKEILAKVLAEKEPKVIPFYKKRSSWLAAATITLLLSIGIFNSYNSQKQDIITKQLTDSVAQIDSNENATKAIPQSNFKNPIPSYNLTNDSDILVSSLFVEDKEIDEYITKYILEDI